MKKDSALALFGSKVRKIREEQDLSQEELAAEADIDRTYIGGVERGERNLSLKNILKIARALKVHPSAFFTGYTK
jgi:transcriptional regulator with XRE-family HTH domain